MTPRSRTSTKDAAGANWQFCVGLALCAAAGGLVYYAGRLEAQAQLAYLRELFAILNQYGGKWIVAGLIALLGIAFCSAALRRMRSPAPDVPEFAPGRMHLESASWMNKARSGHAAGTDLPVE